MSKNFTNFLVIGGRFFYGSFFTTLFISICTLFPKWADASMLSPKIDRHVFECAKYVKVSSIEIGSTIHVWSGSEKLGEVNAQRGTIIVSLNRALKKGEKLTARAVKGSNQSNLSSEVEVQPLPLPLDKPLFENTLYVGGTCIRVFSVTPGVIVNVWNGSEQLGRGVAHEGWLDLRLNRPLNGSDAIQLDAEICGNTSAKAPQTGIIPIMPQGSGPYAEKLPPPTIIKPLVECERTPRIKGLLPGARFQVFAKDPGQPSPGTIVFDHCARGPQGYPILLGRELIEGQVLTAKQWFESLGLLDSDLSDAVTVGPAVKPPAPTIYEPVFEDEREIILYNLFNLTKVEIAVDGKSIGKADYDRDNVFDLGFRLRAKQKIKARQKRCAQWSEWSREITVKSPPHTLPPPKLKEPLYPCATTVRVTKKIKGSLVRIYEENPQNPGVHIFLGEGKLSMIKVTPHLKAKHRITATQTIGNHSSKQSPPIIVKDLPPELPTPKLQDEINSCIPIVTVSNLLPGARVRIFWNKLLVGTAEATNSNIDITLTTKPWPGTKIYGNQSMCMLNSSDSKAVPTVGYLCVRGFHYQIPMSVKANVQVETQCPVNVNTKVKLSSVKKPGNIHPDKIPWVDPSVVVVQGSGESIIPSGKSTTDFVILPVKQGASWLKVSAAHFKQVHEWDVLNMKRIADPHLGSVNVNTETTPKLEPKKIEIKKGESFELKFNLDPVPWANCKVKFELWPTNSKSPLSGRLSIQPNEVIIPAGKKSGTVKIKAIKKGPATGDLYVRPCYYVGSPCNITIKAPAPPPSPTPTVTTKTYVLIITNWIAPFKGKNMYVEGKMMPVPKGNLKKVRNVTKYPWRYNLWFPKYPYTSEDAFDPKKGYMLKSGDEATPAQLGLPTSMDKGITIRAVPSPVDQLKQGTIYLEMHYEVPK